MLGASLMALGVLGPDPKLVRLAKLAEKLKLAGVRPRDLGAVAGESLDSATKVCERVLNAHRRRCAAHPGYEAEARTRLPRHKMARRAWHVMAGARAIKPRHRPIEAYEWPIEAARMCLRAQLQDQYRFMRRVATGLDPRAQLRQLLAEGDAERHRFSWADDAVFVDQTEKARARRAAWRQPRASVYDPPAGVDGSQAPPKRITINLRQPATPPTPEEEARMMEGVEALQRAKAAELARESSLTQSEAEALLKRCGGDIARARGCPAARWSASTWQAERAQHEAETAAWAKQALKDKADHERHRREEVKERRRERRAGVVDLGPDEDGLRMFEPAEPAAKARQRERRAGAKRRRGWA